VSDSDGGGVFDFDEGDSDRCWLSLLLVVDAVDATADDDDDADDVSLDVAGFSSFLLIS